MIKKIIILLIVIFINLDAIMMQEGEFVKQKQELIKLKEELDEFYKIKEQEYQKNKAELSTLESSIQKRLDEIKKIKNKNKKILNEIKLEISSKAMKLYGKMKIKIVKNILQEKLNNGEINEVFDIIIRLKDKRVMDLLKKFDSKTSTMLMDMMNKYKNTKGKLMADENNEEVEVKKKGNPMMIVLILLVVLLIGAVGFLGYMVMNKMDQANSNESSTKKEQVKDEAKDEGEYFKANIKDLVLNITNSKGREKLMKLSFSLKSVEPTIEVLVESSKDEIIDTVIAQISARSSEELLTVGGKELLKEELLGEINIIINEASSKNEEILRNNIKKLFFTTFVIK